MRVVDKVYVRERIEQLDALHIDIRRFARAREIRRDRSAADSHPLLEDIQTETVFGFVVKSGRVAEVAHVLKSYRADGGCGAVPAGSAAQGERDSGVQQEDSGEKTGVMVLRVAIFHYFMNLHRQFGIGPQPAFHLSAVEVFDRQVAFVFEHEHCQLLGRVRDLTFRSVVGYVQVFDYLAFVHGHVFAVKRTLYLRVVPALRRVLDQKAAADLRERVGHVRRDDDTALFLVERQFGLLCVESALAHPQREDGHAERVEISLRS